MEDFKIILLLAIVAVLLSLRVGEKLQMKPWDAVPAKSLAEEADGTKKATKLSNNNNLNKLRDLAKKFSLDKKAARDLTYKVANKRMLDAQRFHINEQGQVVQLSQIPEFYDPGRHENLA